MHAGRIDDVGGAKRESSWFPCSGSGDDVMVDGPQANLNFEFWPNFGELRSFATPTQHLGFVVFCCVRCVLIKSSE